MVKEVKTPGVNPFKVSTSMSPFKGTHIPVSKTSVPAFKNDNALFFYKGGELTIIDRDDWTSINSLVGGNTYGAAIRSAVICMGIQRGYNIFHLDIIIYAGTNRDPIGSFKKISSGTHGVVYLLTFFDVILKWYTDSYIMMMELSIYELICKVYKKPEDMGLPSLVGFGDGYILIPNYTRTLCHKENDEVYYKLARSIHYLHALGVVHRDIKFANVMVHHGNPILLDFGLSTWRVSSSHRSPGTSIQTMWFRAPEVAFDRSRDCPTEYASDWWSYGIILGSINGMMYTPSNNDELVQCFDKIHDNNGVAVGVANEKARGFLHKDPIKRVKGSDFLSLPPITAQTMENLLPIASNIFESKIVSLPEICNSWIEYFTALDYAYYISESEAASLAHIIVGGGSDDVDVSHYYREVEGNLLRLNTFNILAAKYPISDIVFPCFVLSLNGVRFPHKDQAKWIENYFVKDINGTFPEIEKYYYELLSTANSFTKAIKRLGHVKVDE